MDGSGAWRGQYIPAFIRQYPFAIGRGESEAPLVCIDEGSDLISPGEGMAVRGWPADAIREADRRLLKEFHQQMERTKVFAQSLHKLGLLSEVKASWSGRTSHESGKGGGRASTVSA